MVTVDLARVLIAAISADDPVPLPPASTIRSWIRRGHVRRTEDGSVDLLSLLKHMGIEPSLEPSAA